MILAEYRFSLVLSEGQEEATIPQLQTALSEGRLTSREAVIHISNHFLYRLCMRTVLYRISFQSSHLQNILSNILAKEKNVFSPDLLFSFIQSATLSTFGLSL
ncbi:hypothetical protein CULT_1090003 [[Clostridium] ultunense Esp]|nr:hypothetical protein CULT_1090003 [[Clostridium] ultunense Esp]